MAEPNACMLAIDLGTTEVKSAVVSSRAEILGTARARFETRFLPDEGAEQDPDEVWAATLTACRGALDAAQDAVDSAGEGGLATGSVRDRVVGISTCSQYSSIIPVDTDGSPTHNMLVWLDRRGAPRKLKQYPGSERVRNHPWKLVHWLRVHGVPPLKSGVDSMAHMRFVKLALPEVYENTATFLEPMDFVTMRFTGRATTNPCAAFLMLLVDNRRPEEPRYDPKLVRYSGIAPDKLPELISASDVVGTLLPDVAESLGLRNDVKVYAGVNDTQAGGMGCYAFTGNHAGMSLGTTSTMVAQVDFKRTDLRNDLVSMTCPLPGKYFVMGENGIAGRALEHFLENLVFTTDGFGDHSLEDKFEALHRAVERVEPGSGRVLFLPWLSGSMAPAEDGRMRGGFLNMSLETTREHLGRAVLEGIAFNYRWLREIVESFAKRRFSHLAFYGGGAVSDLWSQIIADVQQLPVHQLENPRYAVCRGAGLLGLWRHGLVELDDFQRLIPIHRVYEPRRPLAGLYDELFAQFKQAFRRNRPIFRALNA